MYKPVGKEETVSSRLVFGLFPEDNVLTRGVGGECPARHVLVPPSIYTVSTSGAGGRHFGETCTSPFNGKYFYDTLSAERTKAVPTLSAWHVKLRIRSKRIQK
jgi:hypothetical protein